MRNYEVVPLHDNGNFYWHVYENATEQSVGVFYFEDEALEHADFLEHGGGFDGWTPSFLLAEVVVPKNLNQEFAAFLSD
jgi:hypothetical protein